MMADLSLLIRNTLPIGMMMAIQAVVCVFSIYLSLELRAKVTAFKSSNISCAVEWVSTKAAQVSIGVVVVLSMLGVWDAVAYLAGFSTDVSASPIVIALLLAFCGKQARLLHERFAIVRVIKAHPPAPWGAHAPP